MATKRQTKSDQAGEAFVEHLAAAGPGVLTTGGIAGHPDAPAPDAHPELTASYAAAAADPVATPTAAPARRNRTKADYAIQRWIEPPADGPTGTVGHWVDLRDDKSGHLLTFVDTANAVGHIRQAKVLGRLQVVAVKRELTVEEEQVTRLKVT